MGEDDPQSLETLLPIVYQELRRLAAGYVALNAAATRCSRPPSSTRRTCVSSRTGPGDGRTARTSRHRRAFDAPDPDRARTCTRRAEARRRAAPRHPGRGLVAGGDRSIDLIALDQALERLAALSEEQARLVELRFFGGLTIEETAEAMEISPATVKRHWTVACAWLARELEGGSPA